MKRITIITLAVVLVFSFAAFAKGTAKHPASHGREFSGQITSVNAQAKSLVLHSGNKDLTIYWTDATKVTGGEVKTGEKATIRSMEKNGKWWATSVRITGSAAASQPAATKKAS